MAKIGLIGCGMWGKNLARNLVQLDALVAVADRNAKAANEFASTFNVAAMSVETLIEHTNIDGIVIANNILAKCFNDFTVPLGTSLVDKVP